jgi:hypothetical protein
MTHTQSLRVARSILTQRADGFYPAIRYLRRMGLSFTTARTTVRELQDNAPWYSYVKPYPANKPFPDFKRP